MEFHPPLSLPWYAYVLPYFRSRERYGLQPDHFSLAPQAFCTPSQHHACHRSQAYNGRTGACRSGDLSEPRTASRSGDIGRCTQQAQRGFCVPHSRLFRSGRRGAMRFHATASTPRDREDRIGSHADSALGTCARCCGSRERTAAKRLPSIGRGTDHTCGSLAEPTIDAGPAARSGVRQRTEWRF